VVDVKELWAIVVKMVSETWGVPIVTIWLFDEDAPELLLVGGSAMFSSTERDVLGEREATAVDFVQFMREQRLPLDLDGTSDTKLQALKATYVIIQDLTLNPSLSCSQDEVLISAGLR
jgi:hypothetical protein